MAAINMALASCSAEHPVFYEDEVDIHLNPKIGADWQLRGQQKRVVTPGQNEKYYLAGALHSGTGKVSYVGGNSKGSSLFISLLKHLKAKYRRAKTITLIVDNYIIHKSRETLRWLKENPKFRVIYQPVYSPRVNHVERVVAGAARDNNPKSPVSLNVATVEKSSSLYGYRQPIPRWKTWIG